MINKQLKWVGDSRQRIRTFPEDARSEAGFQLFRVQQGKAPDHGKPMKAIGAGVQEIRIRVAEGQFRILYVVVKADAVYVLHAFQKKGQKTSKQDIELTRKRFKALNL